MISCRSAKIYACAYVAVVVTSGTGTDRVTSLNAGGGTASRAAKRVLECTTIALRHDAVEDRVQGRVDVVQYACITHNVLCRMHEMQTIVTDIRGVRQSVCLSRGSTRLHCAKTAEQIKMLFGVNSLGSQENIVLERSPDLPSARKMGIRCSLRHITLASCYHYHLMIP